MRLTPLQVKIRERMESMGLYDVMHKGSSLEEDLLISISAAYDPTDSWRDDWWNRQPIILLDDMIRSYVNQAHIRLYGKPFFKPYIQEESNMNKNKYNYTPVGRCLIVEPVDPRSRGINWFRIIKSNEKEFSVGIEVRTKDPNTAIKIAEDLYCIEGIDIIATRSLVEVKPCATCGHTPESN